MFARANHTTRIALAALCLGLGASVAHAAPDNGDMMAKFLAEKGIPDPRYIETRQVVEHARDSARESASAIGQQVRNATSGVVISAMNFLGVPYKRGGNDSDSGFDCSGFTRYLYEHSLGLLLPRKVDEQASAAGLAQVKRSELQPGDLVFFNTLKRTFSHVGIYVGDDKFIHAPKPGGEVRVESLSVSYWAKRFTGARRAEQAHAVAALPAAPQAPANALTASPYSGAPNDYLSP